MDFYHVRSLSLSLHNRYVNFLYRSKSLRTPSNMLVVNLAIFDFIMMFDMPMFLMNTWNQSPMPGGALCDVYAVFGSISGIGAAITNAAIALDRFK